MGHHVHLVLLRSVLGIMLPMTQCCAARREKLLSWLQSGITQLDLFPSGGSYSNCKATREHASDAESATLLS